MEQPCGIGELCRCGVPPSDFNSHLSFSVSTVPEAITFLTLPGVALRGGGKRLFVRVCLQTDLEIALSNLPRHIVALACRNPSFAWLTTEETCQVWLPGIWDLLASSSVPPLLNDTRACDFDIPALSRWFDVIENWLIIRRFSFQLDALIELAVKGCISLMPLNLLNDPAIEDENLAFRDLTEAAGLPDYTICHRCYRVVWPCWISSQESRDGCDVCKEAQERYRSTQRASTNTPSSSVRDTDDPLAPKTDEDLARRVVLASIAENIMDDASQKVWKVTPVESEDKPGDEEGLPDDLQEERGDPYQQSIRALRSAPPLDSLLGADDHQVIVKLASSLLNELAESSLDDTLNLIASSQPRLTASGDLQNLRGGGTRSRDRLPQLSTQHRLSRSDMLLTPNHARSDFLRSRVDFDSPSSKNYHLTASMTHHSLNPPPLAHQSLTHQSLTHQSLTHQSLAHQPLTHKSLTQKSLTHQPLTQQSSLNSQPLSHSSLAQSSLAQASPSSHSQLGTTQHPLTPSDFTRDRFLGGGLTGNSRAGLIHERQSSRQRTSHGFPVTAISSPVNNVLSAPMSAPMSTAMSTAMGTAMGTVMGPVMGPVMGAGVDSAAVSPNGLAQNGVSAMRIDFKDRHPSHSTPSHSGQAKRRSLSRERATPDGRLGATALAVSQFKAATPSTSANNDAARTPDTDKEYVEQYVKTRMCQQFRLGQCKRGSDTCRFAHSLQELRATNDVYKTKLCAFWLVGHCKAGPACRHAHGEQELRRRNTKGAGATKIEWVSGLPQKAGIGAGLVVWGTPLDWGVPWT